MTGRPEDDGCLPRHRDRAGRSDSNLKRVIGRLRGIFTCMRARSHNKTGTVGINLTQIKMENRSVRGQRGVFSVSVLIYGGSGVLLLPAHCLTNQPPFKITASPPLQLPSVAVGDDEDSVCMYVCGVHVCVCECYENRQRRGRSPPLCPECGQ